MKNTCFAWLRTPLICAAVALAATSAPVLADPPPWAPAHGQRAKQAQQYNYVYYPQRQVYYAPDTHQWFWLSNGQWSFGINLPTRYQGYVGSGGIPLVLESRRPYVQHVYVEETYGRPWRVRHKKVKQDKHWRQEARKHDKQHDQDRHGNGRGNGHGHDR